MSKVRYVVAMSLDGYIAGPNGEADWILNDPEVDFTALWAQFDTVLMGRRTWQDAVARLGKANMGRLKTVVASRTLSAAEHPDITVLPDLTPDRIDLLRSQSAKDIWLMGGGELFSFVHGLGQVDSVEVSIMPVLLGGGVPLAPLLCRQTRLALTGHRIYASGIVALQYAVQQ